MRLISLMELGSDESGRIPYGAIRDTLQVGLAYLSGSRSLKLTSWLIMLMHFFLAD